MGEHKIPKKVNGEASASPGTDEVSIRRMDHRNWLLQFAQTLEISPTKGAVPMTPFRMGCISRLKMAAEYIALLRLDLAQAEKQLKMVQQMLADKTDELNQTIKKEENDAVGR